MKCWSENRKPTLAVYKACITHSPIPVVAIIVQFLGYLKVLHLRLVKPYKNGKHQGDYRYGTMTSVGFPANIESSMFQC